MPSKIGHVAVNVVLGSLRQLARTHFLYLFFSSVLSKSFTINIGLPLT